MNNVKPKVSIVIPVYNEVRYIRRAIESALGQLYDRTEVVVVDDGSDDGTSKVVRSFGDRVRYYRQENQGAPRARNRGMEASDGRYVLFLDGDDYLGRRCIQALVDVSQPDCVAACSWKIVRGQTAESRVEPAPHGLTPPSGDVLRDWLEGWAIPASALLWPIDVLKDLGGWDEKLSVNQDGDLLIRALLEGVELSVTSEGCVYYRKVEGESSISDRRSTASLKSRMRILGKLESKLKELGNFSRYRLTLARAYHRAARNHYSIDKALALRCHRRALSLGGGEAVHGSFPHVALCRVLGFEYAHELKGLIGRLPPEEGASA